LCWAPESPAYRTWYKPSALATVGAYERQLSATFGVPFFPIPEHLKDVDFADGYHMLPYGAATYSRWLADNHLRPWLASQGLAQ
jgi:hypothetical protein